MAQRKLGRTSNKRRAMLRALVTDLIIYGRVETTEMRAKEVKKIADKMITLGKRQDLHARRQAASYLLNKTASTEVKEVSVNVREGGKVVDTVKKEMPVKQTVVQKLFDEVAPQYEGRNGGYTRVLKTGPRRGDNAPMAIIEFV
ncbi:large subunit ribosomal protein L17 [Bacilli bacterium PM5-3]|nr:large subunit ribosomal protein L17 [Bacilli bacterium PM5-3]MDH6604212.1 large subunit ribosomal protein L17 [Bacilli bacterium PM5-9]